MTWLKRAARSVWYWLQRRAPEFAVLHVTRDEAMRPNGNASVVPSDLGGMKPAYAAWLILHYADIMGSGGYWPEILPESIPRHEGRYREGWFVNAVVWAAEISRRVDQCKEGGRPDGFMLWAYYADGVPIAELAAKYEMSEADVCRAINKALRYCSGANIRRISYEAWCQHRSMLTLTRGRLDNSERVC